MTTRPFTPHYDPFDTSVRTVVGQITLLGVLVLVVLDRLFPGKVARGRLEFMFDVDPKTLGKALFNLETFGFASRSGGAKSELWIATDVGRMTLRQYGLTASTAASTVTLPSVTPPAQPALPLPDAETSVSFRLENGGEILSVYDRSSSSSSDLIDLNQIDQIDLEEEENGAENFSGDLSESGRRAAVEAWCRQNSVTGDKRRDVLAEPFCTVDRLDAWRIEMQRRATDGTFKPRNPSNKFAALNYAIACCLHCDEPPTSTPSPLEEDRSQMPNASVGSEGVLPVGYTPLLNDPVFDRIVLHLAQHYDGAFMTINPRLVASDERPNKFTVLVAADRPELKALIARLAAGFSRKTYQVRIVTSWPTVTSGDTPPAIAHSLADLKLTHETLAGGALFVDAETSEALRWLADHACTTEQYACIYRRLKSDPFWKTKPVSPKTVAKNFSEVVHGYTSSPAATDQPAQYSEQQRSLAAQINARRAAKRADASGLR